MSASRRAIMSSCARASGGFSMLEVLIALIILAFGLLGFALLQTMNLRYTQSANYRTQATNLAYDLLDQMRANRLSAVEYTSATFAAGTQTGLDCGRPVATVTITQNITRWRCQVAEALGPGASATVTLAGGVANVTITWGERLGPDASTVVSTQL